MVRARASKDSRPRIEGWKAMTSGLAKFRAHSHVSGGGERASGPHQLAGARRPGRR